MSTWTEAALLDRIAARYEVDRGNGPAYVVVRHVKNAAGFAATRCLDAVAMSLHPSKGCALDGFEVKTSRSDWLRELRDPTKAEAFLPHLDRFWLVAPLDVVCNDLPATWGWLTPTATGLRVRVAAPELRPVVRWNGFPGYAGPPPLDRGFVAALLRGAARRPTPCRCCGPTTGGVQP